MASDASQRDPFSHKDGAMTTAQDVARLARQAVRDVQRGVDSLAGRDTAIRQMRSEGATLRAIAEAAGLTHTAVANILKKEGK